MANRQRSPLTGRFISPQNSPEATAGNFETYAAGLPMDNISGAASPSTQDAKRHGPSADGIAQGDDRSPLLHQRHPVLIEADERARAAYGVQGALLRDAARLHGVGGMIGHVLGIDDAAAPSSGVQEADDVPYVQADVRGGLRSASRGLGRGRDR